MPEIKLPSQNQEDSNQQNDQNQLQSQIMSIQQHLQQDEERKKRVEAEAMRREEEKKQLEEQQRKQELQAEADLKTLLAGNDDEKSISRRDIEDLSNRELLDVVTSSVQKALEAKSQITAGDMDKKVEEVVRSVDSIKSVLQNMTMRQSVQDARNRFPEFDKRKEDVLAVLNKYPGMEVADAYLLATAARSGEVPPKQSLETERPLSPSISSQQQEKRAPKVPEGEVGVVAFRSLIDGALDTILTNQNVQ